MPWNTPEQLLEEPPRTWGEEERAGDKERKACATTGVSLFTGHNCWEALCKRRGSASGREGKCRPFWGNVATICRGILLDSPYILWVECGSWWHDAFSYSLRPTRTPYSGEQHDGQRDAG